MTQIVMTFQVPDINVSEALTMIQKIHPKINGENNTAYVKRLTKEFWKDLYKEGKILSLQQGIPASVPDLGIDVT